MTALLGILLAIGGLALVGSVFFGIFTFSEDAALGIRRAEADAQEIIDQIHQHPEIVRTFVQSPNRKDRHDEYVGLMVALWFAALGIALVPFGNGAITIYGSDTQKLLAACMLIGSSICLYGAASGAPTLRITWPFRMIVRGWLAIRKRPYHEKETRYCYLIAAGGLFAVSIGMGFFGWAVVENSDPIGTATGLLTPILFFIFVKRMVFFYRTYRRMETEYRSVRAKLTHRHDYDDGEAPMIAINWGNLAIIFGIFGAIATAITALYRARPQRDLDTRTARKIEIEIAKETAALDRRRTIRVLRLEKYVDLDIEYHRKNSVYQRLLVDLLQDCIGKGWVPKDTVLPVAPEPPQLPKVEIDDDEDN